MIRVEVAKEVFIRIHIRSIAMRRLCSARPGSVEAVSGQFHPRKKQQFGRLTTLSLRAFLEPHTAPISITLAMRIVQGRRTRPYFEYKYIYTTRGGITWTAGTITSFVPSTIITFSRGPSLNATARQPPCCFLPERALL